MSTVSELERDAYSAYKAARTREALLLYRQAASEAGKHGESAAWFKNMVWAALSAAHLGDLPQAMRLLFDVRSQEPPEAPTDEARIARRIALEIALDYHPFLPTLSERLQDLRSYAREHTFSLADLEYLAARIEFTRGHFTEAREGFERAWQLFDDSWSSTIKETYARYAIECCLALDDSESARQWITALEGGQSAFQHFLRALAGLYRLLLVLLKAEPFSTLRLREFEDAVAVIDVAELKDECQLTRVRVQLLAPNGGDPLGRAHPARLALVRRPVERWNVHTQFDYRLVFLDYRLAALRYAAGVAAVDDLYYTKPQQVPDRVVPADEEDFGRRLRKARTALASAMAYARKLDGWLECDWRQREVEKRLERIEMIANAAGLPTAI